MNNRFDSILVRLKVIQSLFNYFDDECFDSILVRLKVVLDSFDKDDIGVSIPYWFD